MSYEPEQKPVNKVALVAQEFLRGRRVVEAFQDLIEAIVHLVDSYQWYLQLNSGGNATEDEYKAMRDRAKESRRWLTESLDHACREVLENGEFAPIVVAECEDMIGIATLLKAEIERSKLPGEEPFRFGGELDDYTAVRLLEWDFAIEGQVKEMADQIGDKIHIASIAKFQDEVLRINSELSAPKRLEYSSQKSGMFEATPPIEDSGLTIKEVSIIATEPAKKRLRVPREWHLQAMLRLGATRASMKKTAGEIAQEVDPKSPSVNATRRALHRAKVLKEVNSSRGDDPGFWLTLKGISVAQSPSAT